MTINSEKIGKKMHQLAERLYPINRSITGDGVRETLSILKEIIPIQIKEVASGSQVFDWTVPKEWNVSEAYIEDETGKKIIDFNNHNLHLVGYSIPVDEYMTLDELQKHLYSLEDQPEAIPYVTSYYKERWGFCLTHTQRERLTEQSYHVVINSELKSGSLIYGELLIPGEHDEEVFLSTYVCHPSMANNELSGPVLLTYLTQWIMSKPRKYSYRIVFVPETIGSITYLSQNYRLMKEKVFAGYNITCVGDDRAYSYMPSRYGDTVADRVAKKILSEHDSNYVTYSFLERGSDERQYCSPGIDLPICSIMRSKYGVYPEYHTSLDDLELITPKGLEGAYSVYIDCLKLLENNAYYQVNCKCEPQLGKRGLYPTISQKGSANDVRVMMNFIAYADGTNDLIDISEIIHCEIDVLYQIIDKLKTQNLLIEEKG